MLKTGVAVNELLIKYIVEKLRNGYDIFVTKQEFLSFLSFFEKTTGIKVTGVIKKESIFEDFLQNESIYWDKRKFYLQGNTIYPTNNFVRSDVLPLDINFLGNDMGLCVANAISKFLENLPKRRVVSSDTLGLSKEVGEDISALLTYLAYPDVDKSFLINKEMLDFYHALALRIRDLHSMYPNLRISNISMCYLAYANYLFLLQDLKPIKPSFNIDLEEKQLTYRNEEDAFNKIHVLTIHGEKNQSLVRALNSI